jgi:uncharacterized protein (TIGR04141 family)
MLDKTRLQEQFSSRGDSSVLELIAQLMSTDASYTAQTLKEGVDTLGFSIKLYFRKEESFKSKFASFCKTFVADDQDAIAYHPRSSSSVLFIWNEKNIYAMPTGQGFRMIEAAIVPKFGMMIASKYDQLFKVTSLDSNALSSIIHSTKTVYSNEVDFLDINALDTIFKEVTGRLTDKTNVHSLLNLQSTSKKQSMKITAKDFVQFSSALSFNNLLHLLTVINGYDFDKLSDRFNLISPMTPKKHHNVIIDNNAAVIHAMYESLMSGKRLPYDLFHKNTIDFISADSYIIYNPINYEVYYSQDDYEPTQLVLNAYKNYLKGNPPTEAAFYAFVLSSKLRADRGDYMATDGSILQYVSGEVEVNNTNYYIFYGDYYRLTASYDERLKDSLKGKLQQVYETNEIQTAWVREKNKDEDWFNKTVSVNEGYAHLHKIKPDFIEFCDLLKFDGETITFVHVKDGFDGDMRVLDRQVDLSIRKMMDYRQNNHTDYMKRLYQNASACSIGTNIADIFSSEQDFLDALKTKQIRYIIVIRPQNSDLLECRSNIAKHCLNALILRCFNQGVELQIQKL